MLNTKSLIAVVALTAGMAGAANAQGYINVTVGGPFVPGVFGQVSFVNVAPPPVMDVYPVVVGQPAYGAAPIYLHVALHEYRDWGRYCRKYQACEQPVHFVLIDQKNPWWERPVEYNPRYYRPNDNRPNHFRHDDEKRWDNRSDKRDYRGDRDRYRQNQEDYWEPRFESKRGER